MSEVQSTIDKLEAECKELPKGDPERAALQKRLATLEKQKLLLLKKEDQTKRFLDSIALPNNVPSASTLPQLYNQPLQHKDGTLVKLPVHPALYAMLALQGMAYTELLEPEHVSQAWAMSIAVSSALHPNIQLEDDLGDEFGVACRVDELFGRFLSMMGTFAGDPLSRKRNRTEASITSYSCRPDFMVMAKDTLLFKGEDKPLAGQLADARKDLLNKIKGWSAHYHDQMEFLLCYACAGKSFELSYLSRTSPDKLFPVLSAADTNATLQKIKVIKAALLTYGIITQQTSQLPPSAPGLMSDIPCSMGGRITFADDVVMKRVPWVALEATGQTMERLQRVYAAAKSSPHVVHADKGPMLKNPSKKDPEYSVNLKPFGTSCGLYTFDSTDELAYAIRCILRGVKALHASGLGHGDLRWQNVIKITQLFYCIIDLELAVDLGSQQEREVNNMPTAWAEGKALVNGTYTAASDLYQVGAMLQRIIDMNPQLKTAPAADLASKLASKAFNTADAALAHPWLPQDVM